MAKINPYSLERPSDISESRKFADPLHPNVSFELTLCARSESSFEDEITNKAAEFITDYIKGRNKGLPAPLPPVGGRPIKLTNKLCVDIAGLVLMQTEAFDKARARSEEADEPYTFDEWRVFSATAPTFYSGARDWAAVLLDQARGNLLGNASGADTEPNSVPPSTSGQATTLNSSSEETPSL